MEVGFPVFGRLGAAAYPVARPLLFRCSAEFAHAATVRGLAVAQAAGLAGTKAPPGQPVQAMGLEFPNPVGLAAGMDKDAEAIDAFGAMGFGFVEVGTLTPKPQPGNPKPRLFRLIPQRAVINRMGFNNHGVEAAVPRLARRRYRGILGVNIGKNKATPNEDALDDYLACLRAVHRHADYVAVNFSSPNTPGLRDLQDASALRALLEPLLGEQEKLAREHGKTTPIAVKIAPDLDPGQLAAMAEVFNDVKVAGVIATNTTIERPGMESQKLAQETGGLSGAPLRAPSTRLIRDLREVLSPAIPIIGVGGILCAADAEEKLAAGAALVQIYTGLIYRGPGLVQDCVRHMVALSKEEAPA